jgi:hypothetical protein
MCALLTQRTQAPAVTLANVGQYIPVIHGRDSSIVNYDSLSNPRIFRNEFPVHPGLYPRTIYLVRDPRAVLVSYYQMYCVVRPEAPMTLRAFVEEYLRHGCITRFEPLVRWDKQVIDWHIRAQSDDRILLVKYEEMVKDRAAVLRNVARFCGISYAESDLSVTVTRSSFEEMKKNEEEYGAESYLKIKDKRGKFIRRGKTDGWKEEMEPEQIAQIEKEFRVAMAAAGYLESHFC